MLTRHIIIGLALVLAVPGLALAQYSRGDLNCDGSINSLDIDAFVLALLERLSVRLPRGESRQIHARLPLQQQRVSLRGKDSVMLCTFDL